MKARITCADSPAGPGSDAFGVFASRARGRRDTVLFESKDGNGENDSRSMIFADNALRIQGRGSTVVLTPLDENGARAAAAMKGPLSKVSRVVDEGGVLTAIFPPPRRATGEGDRRRAVGTDEALRIAGTMWDVEGDGVEPVFLPGVFAYDFVEVAEELPPAREDRHGFDDFVFWLPSKAVIIDRAADVERVVEYEYGAPPESCGSRAPRPVGGSSGAGLATGRERARTDVEDPRVDVEDGEFEKLVGAVKGHVRAGDVFQIVPSRTFRAPCPDALAAYGELRRREPSPYLFFIGGPGFTLFGASPEACLKVKRAKGRLSVSVHPIAGTRRRGLTGDGAVDPELDARAEAGLKLNEKEIAEHLMLVDLARNDVARVSEAGSRRVTRLMEVERYSRVMHLVSVVEGILAPGLDALGAYRATANMGTLVGAPKIEAARLLRRYERDRRGPYGGAVGYLTSEGEMDTAIVIRAALVEDGIASVRAGAGVVHDSEPALEADETRAKAQAVLEAIAAAGGGR